MIYEVNAKPLTYDELMEMLDFLTKFGYFDGAPDEKAYDGTDKVIFINLSTYMYFNSSSILLELCLNLR